MKLSKEEFCEKYFLSDRKFYGREPVNGCLYLESLEYLPEGCSLWCRYTLFLDSLKELPEGCTLKADAIELHSLEKLPEYYFIEASNRVSCNIILPTYKGSPEFFFGDWVDKDSFKDYLHIKENPLKFLRSSEPLEVALAEYYLKNV